MNQAQNRSKNFIGATVNLSATAETRKKSQFTVSF